MGTMKIPFTLEEFKREDGKTNRGVQDEEQRQDIKDDSSKTGKGSDKVSESSSDKRKQK